MLAERGEAVIRGLPPDGGLYVPSALPVLPDTAPPKVDLGEALESGRDVARVALWAAPALIPGLSAEALARVVSRTFTFPVPLREVQPGRFVLELFHGPTHAFKDIGARFMAALLAELDGAGEGERTILVATSGDTGGAVADAFHGKEGLRVVALFPADGVSSRQRRQMTTLGGNVHAVAVRGTFDDCQRLAKEALLDAALVASHRLTSANSINVGRFLPQAIYYVYAALALSGQGRDRPSERVGPRFVVPSGNLGNLCAGLLAHRAGMRSSGFIAATNANRGFVDFLAAVPFEPRPSIPTASNAMDVGAPSNLERILWLYGGDVESLRRDVIGVAVSDAEAGRRIAEVHAATGYVLDPHSAVAFEAAMRHDPGSDEPVVVLATAHPAKFPDIIEAMTEIEIPLPPGLMRTQVGAERVYPMEPTSAALTELLEEVSV
jgi:threonine synthase